MAGNSEESGDIVSKPRVSVRTLNGSTHHFDVQECTTVADLKQMVQRELDIPVEIQRLLFQGKILNDTQLLKEANCFNKVVHLIKRAQPPPSTAPSTSQHTSTSTNTSTSTSTNISSTTTPRNPTTTTSTSVMFGSIPPLLGATQQMFNDVWQSMNYSATPPNTSTANTATSGSPASSSQSAAPDPSANNSRTLSAMLFHTRQLLQHCQDLLDKFERGESISPQDVPRPPPVSSGPSVTAGAPLLGDLYLQLGAVYERLQPLLREQARFVTEDQPLEEGERDRIERLFSCLRAVLEPLHVCERNLASFSVSCSQPPPRTVQLTGRAGRPLMSHIHVNQINVTRPATPGTATGSAPGQQPPPPPPIPGEIASILAHTINSMLPERTAPVDLSADRIIPMNSGLDMIASLLHAGIPMDFTILQLARSVYPTMEQESQGDLSSQLLLLICGCLTISQLQGISQGRVESLQAMYPRVKEFVLTKLLPEEGRRGEIDRERAARLLAASAGDENLDGLISAIPDQEGLSVKETLINFLYLNLKTAIALVLDPRNEEPTGNQAENRFGKVIWGWGHSMICELLQLVEVMAHAGSTNVHSVLENYIQTFDSGQPEFILPTNPFIMMLRENREKIDSMIRSSRLNSEQIKEKYFVKQNQDPPLPPAPASPAPPAIPAAPSWLREEWEQCLVADRARLEATGPPRNSFSNSYMALSGLTAEKGESVSCSAEDVLCETLTMSINTSQVAPTTSVEAVMRDARQNSSLKKRYSEYIDSSLNKRLRSDPNYSAERFPNSAEKFNPGDG